MGTTSDSTDPALGEKQQPVAEPGGGATSKTPRWRRIFGGPKSEPSSSAVWPDGYDEVKTRPEKWSLGVLNDRETEEVPGRWILEQ